MNTELSTRESFFTKDTLFYKTLFGLILTITLQNLIAYSVNMLDNIMLGSYSQNALSGAATVNQVFFMVQQTALPIGNALVALASQYWGQKQTQPIRELTGIALKFCLLVSVLVMVVCTVFPVQLLRIFTTSDEIIAEGLVYLSILKWTFVLFIFSNLLIAMLRSVGTVRNLVYRVRSVPDRQRLHQLYIDLRSLWISGNGYQGCCDRNTDFPYRRTSDPAVLCGKNGHKDPPVLQLSVLRKQRTSAILFESRHSDYDHVLVVGGLRPHADCDSRTSVL